jgi:hypothetical protein
MMPELGGELEAELEEVKRPQRKKDRNPIIPAVDRTIDE